MKSSGTASAPGKIILFGEHFVVHGASAILSSVDKRITVTVTTNQSDILQISANSGLGQSAQRLDREVNQDVYELLQDAVNRAFGHRERRGLDLSIHTDIPIGIGLGSSAALSVATIAAVESLFDTPERAQICNLAVESERLVHKDTSGADCYVSTYGGLVSFSKSVGMKRLHTKDSMSFIIGNTGVAHSTGKMVSKVRVFKNDNEKRFSMLCETVENICQKAVLALSSGDYTTLAQLMNQNQCLLDEIGVTHSKAKEIIKIAIDGGALAAKVTGAGGGGAVIALAEPKDARAVMQRISSAGYSSFEAKIDFEGVRIY